MSRQASFALHRYAAGSAPDGPPLSRRERSSLGSGRAAERAAAILAVKQAYALLGAGGQVEVVRREHAGPVLRVDGAAVPVSVSVAHSDGLAVAVVAHPGVVVPPPGQGAC